MQQLQDLIQKLTNVRDELPKEAERVAVSMASNHKAVVVQRIREKGIPGEQYSNKGVKPELIENNSYARQNSAGFDRMIKQKKKNNELVSWKDVREANGLQTNHVDFSFSNRTLNNLSVVSVEVSGFVAKAYLGNTNTEEAYRLMNGYKQYGDFLAPNNEERELLSIVVEEMVNKLFERFKV